MYFVIFVAEQKAWQTLLDWISGETKATDMRRAREGRVVLRRLNRVEYDRTIHDLCGIDFTPADDFPSDDVGHGFDNIGDVLSMPPILLEKYLTAAERVVDRMLKSIAGRLT